MKISSTLSFYALISTAYCQLRKDVGVGAKTPLSQKTKICNIADYGGKADGQSDSGAAIQKAYQACVKGHPGSRLVIPEGDHLVKTAATLSDGHGFAVEIRGRLIRDKNLVSGNMLTVYKSSDVEVFGVGQAAFQGHGYLNRLAGKPAQTQLMKFEQVTEVTIRDLFLIDSPAFALSLDGCDNVDIHGITVRAHSKGGSDGIDIAGNNIHVHHSTVTNKDECVCVKSPATNILIDNIICNHSAGISMGSFKEKTAVRNVEVHHIQTYQCYHFFFIKLFKDGTGFVDNVYVHDITGYQNDYGIDIDAYWLNPGQTGGSTGVALSNIRFDNFWGTTDSGHIRGAIRAIAPDPQPAKNVQFTNIRIWDPRGSKRGMLYQCTNVYGSGHCAQSAGQPKKARFDNKYFEKVPPKGWAEPQKPSWAFDGHGSMQAIPIH